MFCFVVAFCRDGPNQSANGPAAERVANPAPPDLVLGLMIHGEAVAVASPARAAPLDLVTGLVRLKGVAIGLG